MLFKEIQWKIYPIAKHFYIQQKLPLLSPTARRWPQEVFWELKKVFVFRWYQRLAVGDITGEVLNVLVLHDVKECKWSKNLIRVPLKFLKDNPSLKDKIQPVRAELGLLMLHWGGREFLNMIWKEGYCGRNSFIHIHPALWLIMKWDWKGFKLYKTRNGD